MNIMSGRNMWILIGILVIIAGGAAFVFFDPLGLDLLGAKPGAAVVKPAATPHVAAPVAKPPAAAPKAAVASAPVIAPVSAVSSVPAQAATSVTTPAPQLAATPAVSAPVTASSVEAQALPPLMKIPKTAKAAKAKPERSKSADLRDCLKLETDAAIAKCAGE